MLQFKRRRFPRRRRCQIDDVGAGFLLAAFLLLTLLLPGLALPELGVPRGLSRRRSASYVIIGVYERQKELRLSHPLGGAGAEAQRRNREKRRR